MPSFSQLLLPVLLLAPTALAGVDLQETCDNLGVGVYSSCSATYDHPTGYKRKLCNDGVSTCGIIATTEKRWTCDQVRAGLGQAEGQKFLDKGDAICGCLPALKKISVHDSFAGIFKRGDITSSTSPVLVDAAHHIDRCVTDDIIVGDGRSNIIAKEISPPGSPYTAIRAKEGDMDVYKKFIHILESCWKPEDCDRQAIADFFSQYIQASDEISAGPLVRMLNDWIALFNDINVKVTAIKSTANGIKTRLKTVSSKVSAVKKNACKGTACKGKTAATFLTQVSNTLAAVKHLEGVITQATKAEAAHSGNMDLIYLARSGCQIRPEPDYLYALVKNFYFNKLGDLIYGFEVTSTMPDIANSLKTGIVPIGSLTKWSTHSTAASKKIDVILGKNFKNHKELSKTAALRKVRDGFISIQASAKKELRDPLIKLTTQLKALDTALSKFPLRKKKLDWLVGSSSYVRWTANLYNMPCLNTLRQTYNYDGYSTYVDYPSYQSCEYGPDLIYLPNQHIPWLKYRFID
ncbi:hypothetical protein B0J13DRAFT_674044 [Dactylonectria estremocensis]|uniref:Uncharacterized protein n=1 Tax=Dactylonectria estremocensis TaxID=1079267 RepID=A0A9P9F102_9HYPO|nr:hypothetical protein B0J13DRAFT_674044 [Dactylonectria estremocensis]